MIRAFAPARLAGPWTARIRDDAPSEATGVWLAPLRDRPHAARREACRVKSAATARATARPMRGGTLFPIWRAI